MIICTLTLCHGGGVQVEELGGWFIPSGRTAGHSGFFAFDDDVAESGCDNDKD
jgi:hypothetical protein